MKTREELSEGDLYHLETFEGSVMPVGRGLRSYKIGKKIAESLKPKKWKPEQLEWGFKFDGVFRGGYESSKFGNRSDTLEGAERRRGMVNELNIINSYILEANEKDGFIANWVNRRVSQWHPVLDNGKFIAEGNYYKTIGVEVSSKENIEKLCQMLNDGLIDGVSKRD